MKIELGEYVRTKDGKIGIFVKYSSRKNESIYKSPFNCFVKLKGRKSNLQCHRDYIVKHSKNIIDLIEVGDCVNGHKVYHITGYYVLVESLEKYNLCFEEQDIKSIVTKEQFKNAEYRIQEEK